MSAIRGVGIEAGEVVEAFLVGVLVGEDPVGYRIYRYTVARVEFSSRSGPRNGVQPARRDVQHRATLE